MKEEIIRRKMNVGIEKNRGDGDRIYEFVKNWKRRKESCVERKL